MRIVTSLFLILLLALTSIVVGATDYGETYFKFKLPDRPILDKLARVVSLDGVKEGEVYAYANDRELEAFREYGIAFEALPHPGSLIEPRMSTTKAATEDWDSYPTYEDYVAIMYAFEANYPSLCRIVEAGTSVNGRSILFAEISDNIATEEDEPEVVYTSSMHGDETTGFILCLRLIDSLLAGYGEDALVTRLIDSCDIWINPLANPDGTYYFGNYTVNGARRYNANGVDINRNFPDPADGDHPDGNAWQVETQAMMSIASAQSFVLSMNFHGGAEVVNYPWDTWSRSHTDTPWFLSISHAWADSAQANSPSGYMESATFPDGITNGYAWYRVSGGRQDFMNYWYGCREITTEISNTKLLSASLLPAHWEYNRSALIHYLESGLYGVRGLVTDLASGQPLAATIRVLNHDADNAEVFTDPDVGDYHRMIAPGSYDIEFSSPGFTPDTAFAVTVINGLSTRVDIALEGLTGTPSLAFSGQTFGVIEAGTGAVGRLILTNTGDGNASGLSGTIQTSDPFVTISGSSSPFPLIPGLGGTGESLSDFSFAVSSDCPPNHPADFDLYLTGNEGFQQTCPFELVLRPAVEDFETATLATYPWSAASAIPWAIDFTRVSDGFYSVRSGSIGGNQSTSLQMVLNVVAVGELSFDYQISSEVSYDFLTFYVDGDPMAAWSGVTGWNTAAFALSAGEHTLTWTYSKDAYGDTGQDGCWIDRVVFPRIESDLQVVTATLPDWTIGRPYSQQLEQVGRFGPVNWSESGTGLGATGLTLAITGLVSGTPSSTDPISFTAEVVDAAGTVGVQSYEIAVNPAPEISTTSIPDGVRGTYYEHTLESIGGTAPLVWTDLYGNLEGTGLTLQPAGLLSGTPEARDQLSFAAQLEDAAGATYSRAFEFWIDGGCCVGKVGDANNSGDAEPTIGDISALIDFLFISEQPLACYDEADINQSGGIEAGPEDISIGDISMLIDHLFITEPPLPNCM